MKQGSGFLISKFIMEESKISNKMTGVNLDRKGIEEWSLKFTSVLNEDKKREITEWLKQSCPFFADLTFPDDIKIEISEEIDPKVCKILITNREEIEWNFRNLIENMQVGNKYIYVIKTGNAFSWINYHPYLDRIKVLKETKKKYYTENSETLDIKQTVLVKKDISHDEIKENGITFEIYCKGDVIIPDIDLVFSTGFSHVPLTLSIPISIISGTPFEKKCMEPLVLIRIKIDEIKKIFPSKDELLIHFLKYMRFKLFIDRWKLISQWTNNTDIKILCALSLYFSGTAPLQNWKSLIVLHRGEKFEIKEKEIDIKGNSFEKPRTPLTGFKVSMSELILFVGLSRQDIFKHIRGEKSIFKSGSKLTEIIKCESLGKRETKGKQKTEFYRFSSIHQTDCHIADSIRELIFSSLSVTKFR